MKGIYTALITPFDSQGALDLTAFKKILEDQISAGVNGVIPCGTTGESPTLTLDEKKSLIQVAMSATKGTGVKVIAGTGSNDTRETVSFSKWAADQGVAGVLVVTPYYSKPSQKGLVEHFLAVAREVSCEIVLYNVPGRTGVSLTPTSIATLADHPKITSIKEASGNVAFTSDIIDALNLAHKSLDVLSGDDATFLPLLAVGAVGVISVASNLFPRAMMALQKSFTDGNPAAALEIHKKYYPLFRDLFLESNPVPIKFAMNSIGLGGTRVRKPLAEMTLENISKLQQTLKACGISEGSRL